MTVSDVQAGTWAPVGPPFSSYEVLVSGFQGTIWGSTNASVDRVDGTGAVLTAGDTPPGGQNSSQSVRWAIDFTLGTRF